MPFKSEFWTMENVAKLVELAALKRHTAAELGERMGCTRSMIIGKCAREKIHLLTWSEASAATQQRARHNAAAASLIRKQKAEEKRAAILAAAPADPTSLDIAPENVHKDHCRYPNGDGPFTFCGRPRETGSWYCAHHRARCHVTSNRKSQ